MKSKSRAKSRGSFYADPVWWAWVVVAVMALIPLKAAFV
jgi:hypothetical protein